ncbi:homoserine dehydrogenase [Phenylobacterium sp.]|uniref:homoserine dehydrogenase n=1 Tax=Phenylobacterium sp. TaxID=1871053 RepID=UPI0035B30706
MTIRLGLVGFGGVNRALVDMLRARRDDVGRDFAVTAVSDLYQGSAFAAGGLDLDLLREAPLQRGGLESAPGGSAEADNAALASSPDVDVVVEASVTDPLRGEPALALCRAALSAGKSVVAANKGPAVFGAGELLALAAARGGHFLFEGAVMSGTPVLRSARLAYPGARFRGFWGVLNGTSNYVLGRMEAGASLAEAVAEAQREGYAEADPTADIEGYDARLKVVILANLLLGADLRPDDVACTGLSGLDPRQVADAPHGAPPGRWKLIGRASRRPDGRIEAEVAPMRLELSDPLAGVSGPTNALTLDADDLGPTTIVGPGAGRAQTAFALLSDLLELKARIGGRS